MTGVLGVSLRQRRNRCWNTEMRVQDANGSRGTNTIGINRTWIWLELPWRASASANGEEGINASSRHRHGNARV